jgi:hypothetical protein
MLSYWLSNFSRQGGLRAECGDIARHVGSPAGPLFDAFDLEHRHRGFRRDAVDVAEPVAVQHHVTDYQYFCAIEFWQCVHSRIPFF